MALKTPDGLVHVQDLDISHLLDERPLRCGLIITDWEVLPYHRQPTCQGCLAALIEDALEMEVTSG